MRYFRLATVLLTCLLYALSPVKTFAQEDVSESFNTKYYVTYSIQNDGTTEVTHDVTITNLKSDLIVASYSIIIKQSDISDLSGESKDRKVDVTKTEDKDSTKLTARFNDFVIGEGKENKIIIKYKTKSITSKIGKVWNINIPKVVISNNVEKYDIDLIVPDELGNKLFLSPTPNSTKVIEKSQIFHFTKEDTQSTGITAAFGTYQDINFRLDYQLENKSSLKSYYDITLPPEIYKTQQIKYTSIKPEPKYIKEDADKNVVVGYLLSTNEKLNVEVIGSAKISGFQIEPDKGGMFSNIPANLNVYLKPTKYWNTDSDLVKNIAQELKDPNLNVTQNAQKIYQYIITNYKYDFEIAKQPALKRKGAEKALLDKSGWGCMEFTDLYISLARAMGIPARELNGYALTTEENSKPVSLILNSQDKLHAWPEFYDPNFGWVQIDPTWGNTSGIDYFTKLDTNHFVFVIRGIDPEFPLSAGEYRYNNAGKLNTDKMIEVAFSVTPTTVDYSPKYKVTKQWTFNPLAYFRGERLYKIQNTGDTFFYLENGNTVLPGGSENIYLKRGSSQILLKDFNGAGSNYPF